MAGGWRIIWAQSVVFTIIACYSRCSTLCMHAVKGGPACDCEIDFINALLPAIGFTAIGPSIRNHPLGYTRYTWCIGRPGADRFTVYVQVWDRPENIEAGALRADFHPRESQSVVPNLVRVAVVSSPVTDLKGERADEKLNSKLNEGLDQVLQLDVPTGFNR